jgi:hypothetical protein
LDYYLPQFLQHLAWKDAVGLSRVVLILFGGEEQEASFMFQCFGEPLPSRREGLSGRQDLPILLAVHDIVLQMLVEPL